MKDDLKKKFNSEFYQTIYQATWHYMFDKKYFMFANFETSGCRVCSKEDISLEEFTGYLVPAVFIPNLPICVTCKSILCGKQATLAIETEHFYSSLYANYRDGILNELIPAQNPQILQSKNIIERTIIEVLKLLSLLKPNETIN